MSESVATNPATSSATAPAQPAPAAPVSPISPNGLNTTVQNCCHAYNNVLTAERAKGLKDFEAGQKALRAYRNAMPHLTSHANVRGFIACIGHAMLIEIMRESTGTKLLYAAQVALAAIPREAKPVGAPKADKGLT
jgi:hypothetical protein